MSDSKLNYPHESINIVDKEIDVYRDTAIRYCGNKWKNSFNSNN